MRERYAHTGAKQAPSIIPPMPCDPRGVIPSHILRILGLPNDLRNVTAPAMPATEQRKVGGSDKTSGSGRGGANGGTTVASPAQEGSGGGGRWVGEGGRASETRHGTSDKSEHYLEARIREYLISFCRPSERQIPRMQVKLLPAPAVERPGVTLPGRAGAPAREESSPSRSMPASPVSAAEEGTIYSTADWAVLLVLKRTCMHTHASTHGADDTRKHTWSRFGRWRARTHALMHTGRWGIVI